MIGNDVVDLELAAQQSNWRRNGFLEKLFTAGEQELIHAAERPGIMVWKLWSMKEAAYKIYNRHTKIRGFIPHKLHCISEEEVACNGFLYFTKTSCSGGLIHTIAAVSKDSLDSIVEIDDAEIVKDTFGFPYIYSKNKLHPVSVSHHGRYRRVVIKL